MNERKDRIRVQIGGQDFFVVGGGFQEMLSAVKQINGRRFVSEAKVWQLPGAVEDIQNQLDISGYRLEKAGPAAATSPAPAPSAGGDRVRVVIGGRRLAVVGGSFQDMLSFVKSLPQRRFDGETKLWEISGDLGVIKGMIEAAGFQLEGAANLPLSPVPPMEPPHFGRPGDIPPPSFEEPDFFDDEDDLEPPPWLMEDLARRNYADEYLAEPPFEDDELPFTPEPLPARSSSVRGEDRIRLSLAGLPLVVSGGSFQEMLALIKNIPGRRFNAEERVWEIPSSVSLESLSQRLSAAGFVLEQG